MKLRAARPMLVALTLAASACSPDEPQLVVGVATDLVGVADPLASAELTVKRDGATVVDQKWALPKAALPAAVPVKVDGSGTLRIDLVGTLASGKTLTRSAELPVPGAPTRFLRMMLLASCVDVSCGAGRACADGRCVPIAVDPSTLLANVPGIERFATCASGSAPVDTATGKPLTTTLPGTCPSGDACLEDTCYARAASCSDKKVDGTETDVDCGGGCEPCSAGSACVDGADCVSAVCTAGKCTTPSCSDKIKNGHETDVDCGGADCLPCPVSSACVKGSDCQDGVCTGGHCAKPTCTDGVMNGDETDVDCGGPTCPAACALGKGCAVQSDCASGTCDAKTSTCGALFVEKFAFPTGAAPAGVVTADFNRDGRADLAIADSGEILDTMGNPTSFGQVTLLLGNGNGTFGEAQSSPFTSSENPWELTVADLDGDSLPDLVVTHKKKNIVDTFIGGGDGTFAWWAVDAMGASDGVAQGVVAPDLNKDGKLDVVVANGYGVAWRLGWGNGSLGGVDGTAAHTNTVAVVAADFNGDGNVDVAAANQMSSDVSILLGDGTGLLGDQTGLANGTRDFPCGYATDSLALGDFDEDKKLDIATGNESGDDVGVLFGRGDGGFDCGVNGDGKRYAVGGAVTNLVVGDWNGDGHLDVAVAGSSLAVLIGKGDGTFRAATVYPSNYQPWGIAAGDFNADGRPDLALTNKDGKEVHILLNQAH